jgi:hypothetical protein
VARDLVVVCSSFIVSSKSLHEAVYLLNLIRDAPRSESNPSIWAIAEECKSSAKSFIDGIWSGRHYYQSENDCDKQGLFSVMVTNLTLDSDYNSPLSSDARDRVFSLLGLAGGEKQFDQFPD